MRGFARLSRQVRHTEVARIDDEKLSRVARLTPYLAYALASGKERPG